MEREVNKDIKLSPRDAKLGVVCDLSLPTLEAKEMHFKLEIDSPVDPTQEFRKSRTKIAQNRRDKNALFWAYGKRKEDNCKGIEEQISPNESVEGISFWDEGILSWYWLYNAI